MNTDQYINTEGIKCYGLSNNLITRNKLKDCTIIEEDVLLNLNAQELINLQ